MNLLLSLLGRVEDSDSDQSDSTSERTASSSPQRRKGRRQQVTSGSEDQSSDRKVPKPPRRADNQPKTQVQSTMAVFNLLVIVIS